MHLVSPAYIGRLLDGATGLVMLATAGVLMVVGAIPSAPASGADSGNAPTGDPQTVVVVVPRLVTIDFRVVPSLGVDAKATERGDHGSGHDGGGPGTEAESATADTGTNVLLPALFGSALVVLGAVVASFGRRRSAS